MNPVNSFHVFSEDVFLENRELIKTTLDPLKGFHAFHIKSDKDNVFIELGNIQRMPVEVLSISYKESSFQPGKTIILPGKRKLDRNLILPGGYRVVAGEGTKINLLNSASILSYSPLELTGSEDNPVTIYSADLTGQGLVVMNAGKRSTLKYVIFKNLAGLLKVERLRIQYCGGLTLPESVLLMSA